MWRLCSLESSETHAASVLLLSFMASSLRFSSWSKMAVPAPAIFSILVSREEEGEKGTPSHTPLKSIAPKVTYTFS